MRKKRETETSSQEPTWVQGLLDSFSAHFSNKIVRVNETENDSNTTVKFLFKATENKKKVVWLKNILVFSKEMHIHLDEAKINSIDDPMILSELVVNMYRQRHPNISNDQLLLSFEKIDIDISSQALADSR